MAYRIAAIPMTLSDLQSHPPLASLFRWDFSYSCAAVDEVSTDMVRRAVPLRQLTLSFLHTVTTDN